MVLLEIFTLELVFGRGPLNPCLSSEKLPKCYRKKLVLNPETC